LRSVKNGGITAALSYCLSDNSLPHVTVCQFYYDDNQIMNLWAEINSLPIQNSCELHFKTLSTISFDNSIYWFSLIPNENGFLQNMFNILSQKVENIRKDDYDPHLTLFNFLPETLHFNELLQNIDICDHFNLILGECDKVGQLTKILSADHLSSKNILK
jgi:hypothetical protein